MKKAYPFNGIRFLKDSVKIYSFTIVLPAIVTPPICASTLPFILAPVFIVIDCMTITFPFITEVVPNVAELPTCQ